MTRIKPHITLRISAAIATAALAASACGEARYWEGAQDLRWENPANWVYGIVPLPDDPALFDARGNQVVLLNAHESAERLVFSTNYAMFGGMLSLSSGVIDVSNSTVVTMLSGIAGTAGLMRLGTGTLVLSGANTYTGDTNLSGGVTKFISGLRPDTNLVMGTGAIATITGGGNVTGLTGIVQSAVSFTSGLTLNNALDCIYSGTLSAPSLTKTGLGTATFNPASGSSSITFANAITVVEGRLAYTDQGLLRRTICGSMEIGQNATADLAYANVGMVNGTGTLIASGPVGINGGTLSVILGGTGTLLIDGPTVLNRNNLSSPNAGFSVQASSTLAFDTDHALPTETAIFLTGGTVDLQGHRQKVLRVDGSGVLNLQGGTIEMSQGPNQNLPQLQNSATIVGPGTLRLSNGSAGFYGPISGLTRLEIAGDFASDTLLNVAGTRIVMENGSLNTRSMSGATLEGKGIVFSRDELSIISNQEKTFSGELHTTVFDFDGGGTFNFSGVIDGFNFAVPQLNVKSGVMRLKGSTSFVGAGLTVFPGATLELAGQTLTPPKLQGSGVVHLGSPAAPGQLNLNAPIFDGTIVGNGNVSLTGNGTVRDIGTASFSGELIVSSGTANIGHIASPTSLRCSSGPVIFGSASSVRDIDLVGFLTLNGDLTIEQVLHSDTSSISAAVTSGSVVGQLSGSGTLIKRGPGSLMLDNRFSAGIDIRIEGGEVTGGSYFQNFENSNLFMAAGTKLSMPVGAGLNMRTLSGEGDLIGTAFVLGNGSAVTSDFFGRFLDPKDNTCSVYVNSTDTATLHQPQDFTGQTYISAMGTLRLRDTASLSPVSDIVCMGTLDLGAMPRTLGSLGNTAGNLLGTVLASATLEVGANHLSTVYSGHISSSSKFKKIGDGQLTLDGSGTFSGGINVEGGTLTLTGPNVVSQGILVRGLGKTLATLEVNADDRMGAATIPVTLASGTLRALASFQTNRPILLGVGANGNGTINVATSATLTITSALSGLTGLTKTGPGTLQLTNRNTYTGTTHLREGTLALIGEGSLSAQSVFSMEAGTTLDIGDEAHQLGSLAGAGTILLGNSTLTFGSNGAHTTFSGNISGTGGIRKVGPGQTTLDGASSFTRGVKVDDGTLVLAGASGSTFFGGDSRIVGATMRVITPGGLQGSGAVLISSGTLQFAQPSAQPYFPPITTLTVLGTNAVIDCETPFDVSLTAEITGTGTLRKAGVGTLMMYSNPSFDGILKLSAGGGVVRFFGPSSGFSSLSQMEITRGSGVVSDNLAGVNTDRLSDSGTILLDGGSLSFVAPNFEKIGPLVLRSSSSVIHLDTPFSGTASISFASLQRNAGATVNITGVDIGTTNRVLLRTAPGAIAAWLKVNGLPAKFDMDAGIVPTSFPLPGPVMGTLWGDANLDGVVSESDYVTVMDGFALHRATWSQGDFNGDGLVTQGDLNLLLGNVQGGAFVPEPAAVLLLSGVTGMSHVRRRRR